MLDIFGDHGFLVDDKDRLLGRFTDWLETACSFWPKKSYSQVISNRRTK